MQMFKEPQFGHLCNMQWQLQKVTGLIHKNKKNN